MIHTGEVDIVVALSAIWFVIAVIWMLIQLFKFVRPRFPVRVNCWFCNKSTWVLYKASNSWDCPSCLQYNGFTEDGDYNKDIPDQYSCENMSFAVPKLMTQIPNGLCERCNALQEEKIKKLAAFQTADTVSNSLELDDLKLTLEAEYSLCESCEDLVNKIINQKLAKALRNHFNSSSPKYEKTPQDPVSSVWPVFCHMLCFTLAVCLGLSTWFRMDNRDLEIFVVYFVNIFSYKQYATIIPLIVLSLVVIRDSCSALNVGSIIIWMAIHFLPWLIIKTDKLPYLENWTQDNFELVLLSVAAFVNFIAATRRHKAKLKKVQLNKKPLSLLSGKKSCKSKDGNIHEYLEMSQNSVFKLLGPKMDNDIAKQQLGRKQYCSSDNDQLEGSKAYIRASVARKQLGRKQYCSSDNDQLDSDNDQLDSDNDQLEGSKPYIRASIARQQLGRNQYYNPYNDQLKDSKPYIGASRFKQPKLHFPIYGAQESVPRPRSSSYVNQELYRSFPVSSMQDRMLPQKTNQSFH